MNDRIARRMEDIKPFQVMALLARARELEAQGRSIVHMEIGEPDFITPQPIVEAGIAALRAGRIHYTPAVGLPALREAIANWYSKDAGITVPPERIIVTPGASGALLLAMAALLNPGEAVLMADPGYPCNRYFARLLEGKIIGIPVTEASAYQLSSSHIDSYWTPETRAALVASPANPTGTLLSQTSLAALIESVESRMGTLIVDEIYHGLVYEGRAATALGLSEHALVINSFSKYFGMTGWRLGWLVVPKNFIGAAEKLAQNLFLAASTPAQYAALAAFKLETLKVLETRRVEFQRRRDFLLPGLRSLGFHVPVTPQGAFYIYADCSQFSADSFAFARELLEEIGVAVTPGVDFGCNASRQHLRFAYTTSMEQLQEGLKRLQAYL
ncbi:pyridoxal phosphate-dependent aminotransferase [Nitrosococcus oceani]|uniref:Aminotransferase n=2 Tax=Nitrosococcus oceani TaxID=1229 RepID=Q3JCQ2_NITOC|nr:pyridoxal phosphate-dependent aminotransferase [Nitrosococcus oceani]KFI20165.1 aminotransferase [Nitrosococcus oceani C-27]ABA57394.1 aminotransferase [Nitrosococcus oceani ATCC 19707]EDZ67974.1 aminotransferase, classes I and II superfamily [Nitrosococcus oceani AFC27]KFI23468.1 aminotransferase [Nitrosococcus oceani]GEM21544.1 aminotransferase [Nitrosococcus oceani]